MTAWLCPACGATWTEETQTICGECGACADPRCIPPASDACPGRHEWDEGPVPADLERYRGAAAEDLAALFRRDAWSRGIEYFRPEALNG